MRLRASLYNGISDIFSKMENKEHAGRGKKVKQGNDRNFDKSPNRKAIDFTRCERFPKELVLMKQIKRLDCNSLRKQWQTGHFAKTTECLL